MSRSRALTLFTGLGLLITSVVWFFHTFESYETVEDVPGSLEAALDGQLAAKRMLAELGVSSRELKPNDWEQVFTTPRGTILLLGDKWESTQGLRAQLAEWVSEGGRLVLAAPQRVFQADEDDTAQTLTSYFGVRHFYPEGKDRYKAHKTVFQIQFEGESLEARFYQNIRLELAPLFTVRAKDSKGPCVAERTFGRGSIIALCSALPFNNHLIGSYQNATLLWLLTRTRLGPDPVWFVSNVKVASLPEWLWQNAPQATVGVAVALALWLWSLTRRAGPMRDVEPAARRRTMEHLDASGRFAWRYGGGDTLLDTLRGAFNARLERRHPAWAQLPREKKLVRLGQAANIAPEAVFLALEAPAQDRRSFIDAVATLRHLWRSV